MSELVEAAVAYLNDGLTVFALHGKAPNSAIPGTGWREIEGKVKPGDEDFLAEVFDHPQTTGIGIALAPGLVVVDIDSEEGAVALAGILGTPELPPTRAASTGRGLHLYYATTRLTQGTTKLAEKLDLKATGGYVAAPPSIHPSGAVYTWINSGPYEWLPDALVKFLEDRDDQREEFATGERARTQVIHTLVGTRLTPEVLPATLNGLVAAVSNAAEGERNNMLNWAAWKARADGFTYEEVLSELGTAAEEAGLDAQEIKQTLRSAYRARG